jgi:hypothetical protein
MLVTARSAKLSVLSYLLIVEASSRRQNHGES